jgi:hypothetical protein
MTFKQVNTSGYIWLSETKVLLDNQANISIVKPGLLWAVALADKTVKVKLFPVYASNETRANVLIFAKVEELYDITYILR